MELLCLWGAIAWEVIYNSLEDERNIIVTKAMDESIKPLGLQFKDVVYSFLHIIGAREKILPYTDIIRWVVENLNIGDRKFRNLRMELMWVIKIGIPKANVPDT